MSALELLRKTPQSPNIWKPVHTKTLIGKTLNGEALQPTQTANPNSQPDDTPL